VSSRDVEVPAGPMRRLRDRSPVFSWGASTPSDRPYVPALPDPSKPIAFDEHGNPLYAPRGFVIVWPGQG
jgi:hypothetical protein